PSSSSRSSSASCMPGTVPGPRRAPPSESLMPPDSVVPKPPRRGWRLAAIALALVAAAIVADGIATRNSAATRLRERADAQSVPTVAIVAPGRGEAGSPLELPGASEAYARDPIHARVSGDLKRGDADRGATATGGRL